MLWLAFAMMTAAVSLALLRPLSARQEERNPRASDIAFYRSLLVEADDDVRRGLVAAEDAAAARAEIARRLLASVDSVPKDRPHASAGPRRICAVLAVVVVLPFIALALYLRVGAPNQLDMPASRRTGAEFNLTAVIPKIGAHQAAHPNDGHGFQAIAVELDGSTEKARQLWEVLRADSLSNAPWTDAVHPHLAAVAGAPRPGVEAARSGLDRTGVAAPPPEQRTEATTGMVEGLAEKPAKGDHDLDGWLRLIDQGLRGHV
ncbi:c-type cytochrome biogenesis protein CcmI [Bradyrhizobium sp. Arg237L]|uniref:c-type cytochrome biogenesis protein CcmI n=1 Tax=Bradyrhizobium sp. Arg237L TaxID=3003352 RepID=UPI00249DC4FC|nr:c-type cytochrome biogenesis protein CcmI [Bradyrhizobium sp. Arg237L]MDI4237948.1 c-type cytochrome biogenesis protein CcmI [Bradyrhizobium sp. Arg237L]